MASVRILGLALVVALTVAIGWTVPLAAPSAGESAAVSVPRLSYTTRQLKNGLKIYLLQDRSTPNVTVQMWYQVGSKHDPEGRSGFAHLFEHILSRKTRNMPLNMVNQLTEDVGGVRNASTGDDRTNYFEIVPAAYLETMLWTHAERMARPVVDSAVFETERGVVKEELRQRYLAPPYGRFFGFMMPEQCYDTLPNRRPGIGNIDELNSATLDDARSFHEAFYGPDTASLVVSGNFDQARVDQLIDKYFAPIPKRKYPASLAIDATQAPRQGARAVTMYAPNVPLPAVMISYPQPASTDPDIPVLMVIDGIMSTGENSRLYKSLVYDQQIALSVNASYRAGKEPGLFEFYVEMKPGKSVAEGEKALYAELEKLATDGPTERELQKARNQAESGFIGALKTNNGAGQTLGFYGVTPGPYLVLPLLPPLSLRDGFGYVADIFLDPINWLVLPLIEVRGVPSVIAHKNRTTTSMVQLGRRVEEVTNDRSLNLEKFQGVEEATLDLYTAVRNAYLQKRAKAIRE